MKKAISEKRMRLQQGNERYILLIYYRANKRFRNCCLFCQISERTLLYAFENRFNIGNKEFILVLRLNHLYHKLHNEKNNCSIASIAGESGFLHMGQFASDFKKQLGKLPSEI